MTTHTVTRLTALALSAFLFAACGDPQTDEERDLELASQQAEGKLALNDAAKSGGGARPSGGTRPPPAATIRTGTVAEGTSMTFSSLSRICTNTHKVGDNFEVVLREGVSGTNGAVIPAGSVARVEITTLLRKADAKDATAMGFAVKSIRVGANTIPIDSRVTELQTVQVRSGDSKDVQKVVGGAVVGAILGQIIGKDTKSTVIGAAGGAAAGTIVAMATGEQDGCVPDGGRIMVALNSPVTVPIS